MYDEENKMKLSDFLQYPSLDQALVYDEITVREITAPKISDPQAEDLILALVEATSVTQVMEVLHIAYKCYVDGDLIIDIEVDEWPDFWTVVFSESGR